MARGQSNAIRYDRARIAQTVTDIREKHVQELLSKAHAHVQEAKRTNDALHLAEAVRLRDSAAHIARRIEDSRERLKRDAF